MAGEVVENITRKNGLATVKLEWTSDASGDVTYTVGETIRGFVMGVETKPGAATPTAYGIAVNTPNGADVLGGAVTARSTTAAETLPPVLGSDVFPAPVDGPLGLVIDTAGNAKTGEALIFIRQTDPV